MLKMVCIGLLVLVLSVSGWAADCACQAGSECACSTSCECGHGPRAPIGVMGDHVHAKGSWMVSYRYMHMHMEGNRDGTDHIGTDQILMPPPGTYMMAPTSMDMDMHMLGTMYAATDRIGLMLMVPYVQLEMDMQNMAGVKSTMRTDGIGDVELSANCNVWSSAEQQIIFNLGVSLPTGSINEKNSAGARLPYPMQLGSGSYGLLPGLTYTGLSGGWGWGSQVSATIPLNENEYDYTLGNKYDLQGWLLRDLCKVSTVSLRLDAKHWDNIDGADPTLNPAMTPVADPNRRAGTRLDLLVGIDFRPSGRLDGNRLALEVGLPVYQNLDGPQLETDWLATAGWQFLF
ncbi:MAG: transporter [Kiritimatiellales bacterium]|nr:transporter [Kiritimatiellales bacterium]